MSLVPFHRTLIAVSIVFCVGYGVWELAAYARTGAALSLGVGLVFVSLGAVLAFYLRRLNRFLGYERDRGHGKWPGS